MDEAMVRDQSCGKVQVSSGFCGDADAGSSPRVRERRGSLWLGDRAQTATSSERERWRGQISARRRPNAEPCIRMSVHMALAS